MVPLWTCHHLLKLVRFRHASGAAMLHCTSMQHVAAIARMQHALRGEMRIHGNMHNMHQQTGQLTHGQPL
jgi:hypothetical protein